MKADAKMEQLRGMKVDELLSQRGNYIADGKAFVFRCPSCCKENWAAAIASGTCAWCGWTAYKNETR